MDDAPNPNNPDSRLLRRGFDLLFSAVESLASAFGPLLGALGVSVPSAIIVAALPLSIFLFNLSSSCVVLFSLYSIFWSNSRIVV